MMCEKIYFKMSSRDKTRVNTATRMLVYFEIDKSTYVRAFKGRNLLKDSIGGNALIEGVAVMIDYEGQEYQADMQATIIKLNGTSFFNIL
jgi:hypothetical protein